MRLSWAIGPGCGYCHVIELGRVAQVQRLHHVIDLGLLARVLELYKEVYCPFSITLEDNERDMLGEVLHG